MEILAIFALLVLLIVSVVGVTAWIPEEDPLAVLAVLGAISSFILILSAVGNILGRLEPEKPSPCEQYKDAKVSDLSPECLKYFLNK